MNDQVATATPASAPTLIELIDAAEKEMGESGAGVALTAIRESAVALETERALLRADISERIIDESELNKELTELKGLYALEEKDADSYAKRMHLAQNVAAYLAQRLGLKSAEEYGIPQADADAIASVIHASIDSGALPFIKPVKKTRTVVAATSSPIVPLG